MAHSLKSSGNRFHPYQRASNSTNETNPKKIIKDLRSDADDVKCAGDLKLSAKIEIPHVLEADDESDERKCVICLDSESHTEIQSLPCGHTFHSACVSIWLQKKTRCPVCRHPAITRAEDLDSDESDDEDMFFQPHVEVYDNDHYSEADHESLADDEEDLYPVDVESGAVNLCPAHLSSGNYLCSISECPIHGNGVSADVDETDDEDELEDLEWSLISTEDDEENIDINNSFTSEHGYASSIESDREIDDESESDRDSDESDDSEFHHSSYDPPIDSDFDSDFDSENY